MTASKLNQGRIIFTLVLTFLVNFGFNFSLPATTTQSFSESFSDGCGQSSEPWWNTAWTKRVKLSFHNNTLKSSLNNFPLLVKLTPDLIVYFKVLPNGQDLRFIDDDGKTVLNYEIESFNANGESFIWVNVPKMNTASETDHIWLYYGNPLPDPTYSSNPEAVWDKDYMLVQHLKEMNGMHMDSTRLNNDAIEVSVAQQ